MIVLALFLTAGLPLEVPPTADAPARFPAILDGRFSESLSGDDVFALERHVGDAAALVRAAGDVVDDVARTGCTLTSEQANSQAVVGRRLLAVALLEAAKGRAGTAMALSTAADLASALNRCLPFGVATSVASELAQTTATLAGYLRAHGALDVADAAALARGLERLAPEKAAALARPTVRIGPLVLVPASVQCRVREGRTVLTASEAREIGRRYQTRAPTMTPVLGPRGVEGMALRTDAFLTSCGFVDGDVVKSVNGVDATRPDGVLTVPDRIARDRRAVVVVGRGGDVVKVIIEEDTGG